LLLFVQATGTPKKRLCTAAHVVSDPVITTEAMTLISSTPHKFIVQAPKPAPSTGLTSVVAEHGQGDDGANHADTAKNNARSRGVMRKRKGAKNRSKSGNICVFLSVGNK
jgi:hypothetical protein